LPAKSEVDIEPYKQPEPILSESANIPLISSTGLPLWYSSYDYFNQYPLSYFSGLNFPLLFNPMINFTDLSKSRSFSSNLGLPIPIPNNPPVVYSTPQRIDTDFFAINVDKGYYSKVYEK